jgi:integration host factor subunit beta
LAAQQANTLPSYRSRRSSIPDTGHGFEATAPLPPENEANRFNLLSKPLFLGGDAECGYAWSRRPSGMTKADLVEKVTQLGDLTRRDGEVIVETIFDSVIAALQSGDKIEIRGFGSFRIRERNPRIGRNPKTGDRVDVPAKRVPYFKPSKELRDLVNPGEAAAG